MLCQTRIELQVMLGMGSRDACASHGVVIAGVPLTTQMPNPQHYPPHMHWPRSLTRLVKSPSRYEPHFDQGYNFLGKSP